MAKRISPDITAVKALAHPMRMRMLALLRLDGPATATQLAQRLDLNSGATSYHLRQLEQHGFIVEDPDRGTGRERWWQAAHESTAVELDGTDAERDAADAFGRAASYWMDDVHQRAVSERGELPPQWRRLSFVSDYVLRLTADRAAELTDRIHGLLDEYAEANPAHPADPDPEARQYMVQVYGFPRPGQLNELEREAGGSS